LDAAGPLLLDGRPRMIEVFIAGTEPQDKCDLHAMAARMNADDCEQSEENAWPEAR
jgi:hypothetical protein